MSSSINFAMLAKLLKNKREGRGLREIAEEIGDISPSTLSRIEGERVSDLASSTLLLLCDWLGISVNEIVHNGSDSPAPDLDTLDNIDLQLRAAKDLDKKTARMISAMFKAAREEMSKSATDNED